MRICGTDPFPLRSELTRACAKEGFTLRLAERELCTDNAAMIGILAEQKLLAGVKPASFDEEIKPGWELGVMPGRP
jgi:tRNA A37 threonylcarbamoyltransferase TsaD